MNKPRIVVWRESGLPELLAKIYFLDFYAEHIKNCGNSCYFLYKIRENLCKSVGKTSPTESGG